MTIRFNWGTGIAVAYTTFALATIGFVGFAMQRPVDLVSGTYYAESLVHDARMTALANAEALGDGFTVGVEPDAGVSVRWPATMAADVRGTATFYRPSDASLDRLVPLVADASGAEWLPLTGLAPGRWQLRLAWRAGGRDYLVVRDLDVPAHPVPR